MEFENVGYQCISQQNQDLTLVTDTISSQGIQVCWRPSFRNQLEITWAGIPLLSIFSTDFIYRLRTLDELQLFVILQSSSHVIVEMRMVLLQIEEENLPGDMFWPNFRRV